MNPHLKHHPSGPDATSPRHAVLARLACLAGLTLLSPFAIPSPAADSGLVPIPAGTFLMGSPVNEAERENNEVQHAVSLSAFFLGRFELTQAEWTAVMGNNPSTFRGGDLPVENVSWFEATIYCNKRSLAEGLTPCYRLFGSSDPAHWGAVPSLVTDHTWDRMECDFSASGYRLPTEAEWEYACRAGGTAPFNTGNNIGTDQANYQGEYPYDGHPKGEYRARTTPVGSFAPNVWGLYDMHGNVWEWCWDWIGDYPHHAETNPTGALSYFHRVVRGGSWHNYASWLRSAYRSDYEAYSRYGNRGFRIARR